MDALPALMVTLKFLADTPLTATGDSPLLLSTTMGGGGKPPSPFDLAPYQGAFPCALVIADTGCNAWSGLSRSAAEELRREAAAAVALLQANVSRELINVFVCLVCCFSCLMSYVLCLRL